MCAFTKSTHRCTCTHTWYKNKTCEDGSTLASTFRLLSIFTVEGLKYNCIGSKKKIIQQDQKLVKTIPHECPIRNRIC